MAPGRDQTRGSEGMKKTCTEGPTEKLEVGGPGSRVEKWQHLGDECVYCVQLNREECYHTGMSKEAGCVVKSWTKEATLANLSRNGLCRGAVFRP